MQLFDITFFALTIPISAVLEAGASKLLASCNLKMRIVHLTAPMR
jgi:hypothetical protein